VAGVVAAGLCGFSKEEGLIPVNKNLWWVSSLSGLDSWCDYASGGTGYGTWHL